MTETYDDELVDFINHLVFLTGTGPNGSGGEIQYWTEDGHIPAIQAIKNREERAAYLAQKQIKDLILKLIETIDNEKHLEIYQRENIKHDLRQKIQEL